MQLNSDDKAILVQALKNAAQNSTDYAEIEQYQHLLAKMDEGKQAAQTDGFRYDYDD